MPNGFVVSGEAARNTIANIDLWGLVSRIDRMRIEVNRCQSANLPTGLIPADMERLKDFTGDIKGYLAFVAGKPFMDLPEVGGHLSKELPDDSHIESATAIENEDLRNVGMSLVHFRIEVQNCQSARLPQGLNAIARIEALLSYVAAQEPSDRPESTPSSLPTAPGNLGD
jgi:hypothetical protein